MTTKPQPIRHLESLAAALRERGWTVNIEITESFAHLTARGEAWDATCFYAGAFRNSITGRWNSGDMVVYSLGRTIVRRTYWEQGAAVDVYATDYTRLAEMAR
jgi:hypothetical protein